MTSKDKAVQRATEWNKNNRERRREIVRMYDARNRLKRRIWRDIRDFGAVQERKECARCGIGKLGSRTKLLGIHHIDGNNGKQGKSLNNEPANLIVLCQSCHIKVHNRWKLEILTK